MISCVIIFLCEFSRNCNPLLFQVAPNDLEGGLQRSVELYAVDMQDLYTYITLIELGKILLVVVVMVMVQRQALRPFLEGLVNENFRATIMLSFVPRDSNAAGQQGEESGETGDR